MKSISYGVCMDNAIIYCFYLVITWRIESTLGDFIIFQCAPAPHILVTS